MKTRATVLLAVPLLLLTLSLGRAELVIRPAAASNDKSAAAPRVHALLVGGSIIKDNELPGSPGAGPDCADFESLLRDHFNIPASQITMLTGESVTTEAFTKALTKVMVEDARSGDSVIFYYSGLSIPVPDVDGDETASETDTTFITYYLTRALREVSPDLGLTHIAAVVKSTVAAFTTVGGKTAQNPVLLGNVGLDEQEGTFFGKK